MHNHLRVAIIKGKLKQQNINDLEIGTCILNLQQYMYLYLCMAIWLFVLNRFQHLPGHISVVGPPNQLSLITYQWSLNWPLIPHDFKSVICYKQMRLNVWDHLSQTGSNQPPPPLDYKSDALCTELTRRTIYGSKHAAALNLHSYTHKIKKNQN